MPTVYLQDGVPIVDGGAVAISDACCCDGTLDCPCPDLSTLCVSISIVDYNGNTLTADQDDIFWDEAGTYGSVFVGGFEYQIEITCAQGVLTIAAFWAGYVQDCNCTAGFGEALYSCTQQTQATYYLVTASFEMQFYDVGSPCFEACPDNPGSVTVTISAPPC